jgi:hypothetical protein
MTSYQSEARGKAPLNLAALRSPSSSSESSSASPTSEKRALSYSPTPTFRNDLVEDDCMFITAIADDEDPDIMLTAPWRRIVASFFSVTAIVEPIIVFFTSRTQLRVLNDYWRSGTVSIVRLLLVWFLVVLECLWAGKYSAITIVT